MAMNRNEYEELLMNMTKKSIECQYKIEYTECINSEKKRREINEKYEKLIAALPKEPTEEERKKARKQIKEKFGIDKLIPIREFKNSHRNKEVGEYTQLLSIANNWVRRENEEKLKGYIERREYELLGCKTKVTISKLKNVEERMNISLKDMFWKNKYAIVDVIEESRIYIQKIDKNIVHIKHIIEFSDGSVVDENIYITRDRYNGEYDYHTIGGIEFESISPDFEFEIDEGTEITKGVLKIINNFQINKLEHSLYMYIESLPKEREWIEKMKKEGYIYNGMDIEEKENELGY